MTYPKAVCEAATSLRYQDEEGGTRRHLDKGPTARHREGHHRNHRETGAATAARPNRASRSSLS